jgi:hypothetical protein
MIWVGVHSGRNGDPLPALEWQRRALTGCTSEFLERILWHNMAFGYALLGRFCDAVDAARRGALVGEATPRAAVTWLWTAVQAGDVLEVRRAASCLRDAAEEGSEEVTEYVQFVRASRERREWRPTRQARDLTRRPPWGFPVGGERVLEVFV